MKFTPHEYQKRAIDWIESHPRCLLFLDMGLGKTVSTLTAVQDMILYGEVTRCLVIAPKKVAEGTWATEAAKWDHLQLRVSNVTGDASRRRAALAADADVYVIGRDSVAWLHEELGKDMPFDCVVLDELTSFKNAKSQRFKHLNKMLPKADRVIGLTGTPAPNGLQDLWAQVYCIDGGERYGRSLTRWRTEHFDLVEHNHIIIKISPKQGAEKRLMGMISDITLTMTAKDWLSLPPMVERDCAVTLPPKVLRSYRDFEREKVLEAAQEPVTAASAAALGNKLAQYANGAVYSDDGESWVGIHDEKLEALGEILESAAGPVLCFYQYRHDLERIMSRFAKLKPRLYQGEGDLKDWNDGKIRLLLAHPASTAFGLNMQGGGSTIVWFSTGWNLELYQQANARLHRQGQTRPVTVHRLIAAGTIDERMAAAIGGKSTVQTSFINQMKKQINQQKQKGS